MIRVSVLINKIVGLFNFIFLYYSCCFSVTFAYRTPGFK
jgi:hypothetical protein